jgi:hypothetical protein
MDPKGLWSLILLKTFLCQASRASAERRPARPLFAFTVRPGVDPTCGAQAHSKLGRVVA